MPEMDGLTLRGQFAKMPEREPIPIIAMTAAPIGEARAELPLLLEWNDFSDRSQSCIQQSFALPSTLACSTRPSVRRRAI